MNENFTSCLICKSGKLRKKEGYEKDFLTTCRNCGFVFCDRIPTEQELIDCYQGYTREEYISPLTVKRYHELLDGFEKYRKNSNIIDVGAGNGFFLAEAKKRGWNVYGTEFEQRAVDLCIQKGIHMNLGKLDYKNYPEGHFDIITSFEVIEHINNPLEELRNFNAILRRGGIVYLTTPNFDSISRYYLKGKWSVVHYPEHLSYYTTSTLQRLFESNGFKKDWIRTSNIQLSRLNVGVAAGRGEASDTNLKEEDIRVQLETKFYLKVAKKIINSILHLTRKGDSLKAVFIKQ